MDAIKAVTGTWMCLTRRLRSYQFRLWGKCKMLGAPRDSKEKSAVTSLWLPSPTRLLLKFAIKNSRHKLLQQSRSGMI